MANIWCDGEARRFPDSEFRHDANGQIAIPYIHERGNHHFINGTPVKPDKDPPTNMMARRLQQQLDSLLLVDEADPKTQKIRDLAWELHELAIGLPLESLQELVEWVRTIYKRLGNSDDEGKNEL